MRAKDFRTEAWQANKGQWGKLALMTLIVDILTGACVGIGYYVPFVSIAFLLIGEPLMLGMIKVALRILRRQPVALEGIFSGFPQFGKAFLLQLVNEIFIFLWSLLFWIPGIVKALAYSMSMYLLADDPTIGITEARKKSMELMKGYKWKLFCLEFSFIGWYLLSVLTLGILLFWVTPYVSTATAAFYENLLEENGEKSLPRSTYETVEIR